MSREPTINNKEPTLPIMHDDEEAEMEGAIGQAAQQLPLIGNSAARHHRKVSWARENAPPPTTTTTTTIATRTSCPGPLIVAPPPVATSRQQEQEVIRMLPNMMMMRRNVSNRTLVTRNTDFLVNLQRQSSTRMMSPAAAFASASTTFTGATSTSSSPNRRLLDLNDVLGSGPIELEAETRILKACEQLQHRKTHTETSEALFSTVSPDDDLFRTMVVEDESDDDEEEEDDDEEQEAPTTTLEAKDGATTTAEEYPDCVATLSDIELSLSATMEPQQSTTTTSSPRTTAPDLSRTTTMSQSQRAIVAHSAKAKFRKVVRKQIVAKSVEHTLFGLTSTLHKMGEEQHQEEQKRRAQHHRIISQINDQEADRLAATANSLAGHITGATTTTTPLCHDADDEMDDGPPGISKVPSQTSADEFSSDDEEAKGKKASSSDGIGSSVKQQQKTTNLRGKSAALALSNGLIEDFQLFQGFLSPRKAHIKQYIRHAMLFVVLPSLATASILFYFVENPELCEGKNDTNNNNNVVDDEETSNLKVITIACPGTGASVSWWLLFIGVRQAITLTMALTTQAFVIDFLALGTRLFLKYLGPLITLLIVKSKGWPFIITMWGVYDLALLSGSQDYAHHWGYWQDWVGLFNKQNPSGHVVDSEWNYRILKLAVIIGAVVAVKRLVMSLFLGRQTFGNFSEQLALVMKNMLLIGQVATLAKDIEYTAEIAALDQLLLLSPRVLPTATNISQRNDIQELVSREADAERAAMAEALKESQRNSNVAAAARSFMASRIGPPPTNVLGVEPGRTLSVQELSSSRDTQANEDFSASEKCKLSQLLDAWEEPQTAEQKEEKKISIGAVLQFRQALTFMEQKQPFLPAFGPADSRERCIESAQKVFDRLMLRTPDKDELPFETLALLSKDSRGGINQEKAKELIKVFRPERDGKLSKLEFVKSIDTVYKSIRLLSANVNNSSQLDAAVKGLISGVFYVILGTFVLAELGIDPLELFFSLSSVILAFAFMFGRSSSNYFEGILFILVQRPYGVGDRIHLSNPQNETNVDGSSGWIVERVSLYSTSLYWGATNERCTINNGAIANLRVINANRSPHAQVYVHMKFSIDTPFDKIMIFKTAVQEYVKDRPREWLTFIGFRPTEVAVDKSYINYKAIVQHRNSWQGIGGVNESKGYLVTYCLEVAKQLEMRYVMPNLPVSLQLSQSNELTPKDLAFLGL